MQGSLVVKAMTTAAANWAWGLGIAAVAVAGGVVAFVVLNPAQPAAPAPGPGPSPGPSPAPSPSPAPGPSPSPSPSPVQVTLQPGTMVIQAAPGASVEIDLPNLAVWGAQGGLLGGITATGNASVGSAPTAGSNPASLVYQGGGAQVVATWYVPSILLPTATEQTTTLTISDA